MHTDSISVHLTPVGTYQELFVKNKWGTQIMIQNNAGGATLTIQ